MILLYSIKQFQAGSLLLRVSELNYYKIIRTAIGKLKICGGHDSRVPDYVQEKRFHNWLESAIDWAVSRNRYWGTPIPIWTSDDGQEIVVIGSIAELEKLSGVKGITDLHRER